jgi:hypothetical protein
VLVTIEAEVINDHEPMIPTGDGQTAEARRRQTAGPLQTSINRPDPHSLVANGEGKFFVGLVDWRHGSVAVLLPCGCRGVWPNVLDRDRY